jgi:hypothetical protein
MSNTALLFLFLFPAGLLLAFVKHPIYGMYSYMLVFYMSPEGSWWNVEVPNWRWSLLAAAVTMIAAMRHPSPPSRPPWYKTTSARWLIAFSLWLWIQTPWALSLDNHIFMAVLFSKYVLLYAVLYTCLTEPKNFRQFYFAHLIGCFLWGYMAYQNPGSGRLENLGFGDVAGSAFASMQLGTGLAFAGFAFLGASGVRRWLAFSSIPFILNAIILMATRGAFVGLLGGVPAAILFSPKSRRRLVILSLAIAPILLFSLAHDIFWSRMTTIIPPDNMMEMESSAESRLDIAHANFQMFLDYPMGVGHRGNETLSPRYMPPSLLTLKDGDRVRSAHNTFMAVLVDHGFIGLFLIVLFQLSIIRSLIRTKSRSSPSFDGEFGTYAAALGTALVIYWGNAQFVNVTKAEVVIWIAVLTGALQWMANLPLQSNNSGPEMESASATHNRQDVTNPSA